MAWLNLEEPIKLRLKRRTVIDGECMRWTGAHKDGYGRLTYKGRSITVHRLSAHLYLGLDLDGDDFALHKTICKHKDCWNPDHLYVGDRQANDDDRIEVRLRQNTCPRGHLWRGKTFRSRSGSIICKICRSEIEKRYRQRKKKI